jgi:hypothetical protein
VTAPFDTSQPGAVRLLETARRITAGSVPVAVEIRRPVLLADEDRHLAPGERTTITADWADHLVDLGCAVRI